MALKISLIFCMLLVLSGFSSLIPSGMAARVISRNLPLPFIQISRNDNDKDKAASGALELEIIPRMGAMAGGGRRRLSQTYATDPYFDRPPYGSSPVVGNPPAPHGK